MSAYRTAELGRCDNCKCVPKRWRMLWCEPCFAYLSGDYGAVDPVSGLRNPDYDKLLYGWSDRQAVCAMRPKLLTLLERLSNYLGRLL